MTELNRVRIVKLKIRKAQDKSPPDTTAVANQFCICPGPDTGSFMIQCDECREWYHGSCVKAENFAYCLCHRCDC